MPKPWLRSSLFMLLLSPVAACGGDDGAGPDARPTLPPLFEPKPECMGAAITPYAGTSHMVISSFGIGTKMDGFDLDGDGQPDNKLAGIGSLAQDAIDDSLADYSLIIPFEFFDLPAIAADSCVKFALYAGEYTFDRDGDNADTARDDGECNDSAMGVNASVAEVVGNFLDDDCDGLADEDPTSNAPSTDAMDRDTDGVSIAAGDCDDTNNLVGGTGATEVCGDGLDNDCDGRADRGVDGTTILCNPFDTAPNPETLTLDPLSFAAGGAPVIAFTSGEIVASGAGLQLKAGPGLFSVAIPVTDDLVLDLRITGATIEADVIDGAGGAYLSNGRLGGVLDVQTADTIRGLDVEDIGLTPDKSLLDATFANLLGPLLALPLAPPAIRETYDGCRTPDIDVDRDGLEIFCDTDSDNNPDTKVVDLCVDGDGTEVRDTMNGTEVVHCTQAKLPDGTPRFVDGISVELNFETAPATLVAP